MMMDAATARTSSTTTSSRSRSSTATSQREERTRTGQRYDGNYRRYDHYSDYDRSGSNHRSFNSDWRRRAPAVPEVNQQRAFSREGRTTAGTSSNRTPIRSYQRQVTGMRTNEYSTSAGTNYHQNESHSDDTESENAEIEKYMRLLLG